MTQFLENSAIILSENCVIAMYSLFITFTDLIFSDLHIDKIRKSTFHIYLNYWQSKEIMTVRNLRIMFL